MSLLKDYILRISRRLLSQKQIDSSLVFWNTRILKKGEVTMVGPQNVVMPFEGTIVFVDLAPRVNWAHPTLFMLVDAKNLETKTIESSFPPIMDKPGDDWLVILRYGKRPPDEKNFSPFGENNPINKKKAMKN